nr:MAG TPA: hypothetical protein [Caudoviricetes sp.]
MTIPRLASDGVGRGRFMPCVALCGPLWAVLVSGNIGTLQDGKAALRACKWPLRRFCFCLSPAPLRKNAACGPLEGLQAAVSWWRVYRHEQKKTRPREAPGGL